MNKLYRHIKEVTNFRPLSLMGWILPFLYFSTSGFAQIYISEGTQFSFSDGVEISGELILSEASGFQSVYSDHETLIVGLDIKERKDGTPENPLPTFPEEPYVSSQVAHKADIKIEPEPVPVEPARQITRIPADSAFALGNASGVLAAPVTPAESQLLISTPFVRHSVAWNFMPLADITEHALQSDYQVGYSNRPPPARI